MGNCKSTRMQSGKLLLAPRKSLRPCHALTPRSLKSIMRITLQGILAGLQQALYLSFPQALETQVSCANIGTDRYRYVHRD